MCLINCQRENKWFVGKGMLYNMFQQVVIVLRLLNKKLRVSSVSLDVEEDSPS